jgi:hypothetical protein
MEHETVETAFNMSPEELAKKVGDLRYDALASFLWALFQKLRDDSRADVRRRRPQLAARSKEASLFVRCAAESMSRAWKLCKPYMQ